VLLAPEDRERLIRYVDFLDAELSDYAKFAQVDWKRYTLDRDMRRNLERWIENIVNCSIDIAKVILASEGHRIPTSYRETLRAMGTTALFDEAFGEAVSQWAPLRNILAHEYLDVRWKPIRRFIQGSENTYRKLTQGIRDYLA
jgi:uncharacterized protein YutE (UPF0331/DUF86 family)